MTNYVCIVVRQQAMKTLKQSYDLGLGSCQAIFTDVLAMKHAAAKIVPKLLNFKQKQRHKVIGQEILATFNDDPDLLKMVITGEESCLYGYDIEIKAQSFQWKRPEKPRPKN